MTTETLFLVAAGAAVALWYVKQQGGFAALSATTNKPAETLFVKADPPVQVSMNTLPWMASDDALAMEYFSRIEKRHGRVARLDAEQMYLDLQNAELQQRKSAANTAQEKTV